MFGPSHYVPILRWKQAERYALRNLRNEDRDRITPLIELTPTIFKSRQTGDQEAERLDPAQVLEKEAKKLLETCLNRPFFLDLRHVTVEIARSRGKVHALEYLAEIGRAHKLALVPVTGLSRSDGYQSSGHQPQTMSETYSRLDLELELRLEESESMGVGFTIPPSSIVPSCSKNPEESVVEMV